MAFICPLPFDVDVSEEHCRSEAGLPDHPLGSLVVDVGPPCPVAILSASRLPLLGQLLMPLNLNLVLSDPLVSQLIRHLILM